jgi:hypothetical protein
MAFNQVKSYPTIPAEQVDVPASMQSNNDARVFHANKRIVSVASSNGDQRSGGMLSFILPSGMGSGFLKSNSCYLKCNVAVTQPNAYSWAFRQYGSAHSIVSRETLLASGAIVEQISQANKLYSSLLLHASNYAYAAGDDKVYQCSFGGDNGVANVDVIIPIILGSFCSAQDFPLFLVNSLQLNLDLDNVLNSITQLSADAVSEFTVSKATLVFDQVIPDSSFEMSVKQMLMQGKIYNLPINTWYNLRTAQTGAVTQNIGLNSSSLKAVLWNTVAREAQREAGHFTNGGQTSVKLYLDGALVSNHNLDNVPQQFVEMNRALNTFADCDRTSVAPTADTAGNALANDFSASADRITRTLYASGAYLGGLSTSKSSEGNFSMSGLPCSSAVLEFLGAAGGTFYIYCALQQIVLIGADGSCTVRK